MSPWSLMLCVSKSKINALCTNNLHKHSSTYFSYKVSWFCCIDLNPSISKVCKPTVNKFCKNLQENVLCNSDILQIFRAHTPHPYTGGCCNSEQYWVCCWLAGSVWLQLPPCFLCPLSCCRERIQGVQIHTYIYVFLHRSVT